MSKRFSPLIYGFLFLTAFRLAVMPAHGGTNDYTGSRWVLVDAAKILAEAKAQGIAYEVTRYDLNELDRAIADGAAQGFVKVLTVPGKDRILGATIVGAHAGDLLPEFVLAMQHGMGLNKILGTVHSYPTWAEANKFAAGQWRQAHQPDLVLRWLERFHRWRRG